MIKSEIGYSGDECVRFEDWLRSQSAKSPDVLLTLPDDFNRCRR